MNYVRLGDLCVINSGGTPRRNNESYWKNGDIPWVKISDLNNGVVESTEEFITLDGLKNSSAKIFPQGTLLYTIFATIGEVAILNIDAATNQAIVGLQLKENQKVYLKYIYYYLKSQTNIIKQLGRGVAQNNINLSVVKNMIIPIVSLEKQSNIIATLSKLEKIKENRIIISNYLDSLIKSRFVEMFGDLNHNPLYPVVNLKNLIIGSPLNGFFASKELYDKNGKVKLVGVKEVVGHLYTNICDTSKLDVDDSTLEKYLIDYGDMLFCRSSLVQSGIAKASIVPKLNNKSCIFECHIIKIKLDQQLCIPEFMQVQSEQTYFRNQVIKNSKTATMTTISQQGIVDTKVLLPPLVIQQEFTKFLSQINKLKSDVQKSIDETQLLMDSLMQEYFG